ncbi:MAG TPA: HDIG domain-containing protein, partial [Clostridia bacterium]|nr:HDIG domain-containing protein [Clostridia bacterium]
AFLAGKADARLSPALVAIMLCALLADERAALALTPLMAVTLGIMAASGDGAPGAEPFSVCVSTLAAGAAAVIALRKTQSRGALIGAGAVGGLAASLGVAALALIKENAPVDILVAVAWTFGSAMISTLLVAGSLSLWEVLFDVATPARLNELGNANQPLLRELMTEAPGTYQHAVLAGSLAEAAAERVGADPLLARVACYYHDVGKLRRPQYFMENQKGGDNIHDTLSPLESAQAIIAHQKDGVQLLTKYKLPSAVVRISAEHHGNSLVTYFYYKAKQADEGVSQKGFRYPGNRPSTKESAIVMLADCCEAAVRSLGETNAEAVAGMVHRIVWTKLNPEDNQLANAPLTMAELTEIEKSFLRTFSGIMHDRIEYPDPDEAKK